MDLIHNFFGLTLTTTCEGPPANLVIIATNDSGNATNDAVVELVFARQDGADVTVNLCGEEGAFGTASNCLVGGTAIGFPA